MLRLAGLLVFLSFVASAQKQLVLLQRGNLVQRFREGEYIHFIMKDGTRREGMIVELLEFSVITSNDTVQFIKIQKVGIPKEERKGVAKKFGSKILLAGILLYAFDAANAAINNSSGVDPGVAKVSAALIVVGSILTFVRPKWRRVNQGTFLRTVDYKSPFYKSG